MQPAHAPESTYAWWRLGASVALMTLGGSGMYAISVVLPAVQADFGVARAAASLPYTLTMIGFGIGGILMGRLADRFGVMVPTVIGAFALSAGFLLMGPFLCLGLYRASQRLEAGEKPDFGDSLLAWDTRTGQLAIFGFVLLVLEMLWARATLVVFAVTFDGMPDFKGSLLALLDPENLQFIVAYLLVGGFFAGLIFAVSVVSIPMILDRRTDAITAALTSVRVTVPPMKLVDAGLL